MYEAIHRSKLVDFGLLRQLSCGGEATLDDGLFVALENFPS
jgi:hypothetical protein